MLQSMNRYAWVGVATVALFTFSSHRPEDPMGAAVISIASGIVIDLLVLAVDGIRWLTGRTNRSKYPALILAAADGNIQRIEKALAGGANVDERGPNDETALMLAAGNGRTEAVEFLLAKGADRTVTTRKGSTAAALAARFNHAHIANLLSK
jgi:ankyrin repeat protein